VIIPDSLQAYLSPALVRVKSADGRTMGVGFLAGKRSLITCAHVVDAALGRRRADEVPVDPVIVEFAFCRPSRDITARVKRWSPERKNDVAVLQLSGNPPDSARPIDVATAAPDQMREHSFYAFGFPSGPEGKWAHGRIVAQVSNGWIQLEDDQVTGARIQGGFSGTPVWDADLHSVVGMIVAEEKNAAEKIGYLIPTQSLYETWFGFGDGAAGSGILNAHPRNVNFGSMSVSALYYSRIRVTNRGSGLMQWAYESSDDQLEAHRDADGIVLRVARRAQVIDSEIRIRSTGGEAAVRLAGNPSGKDESPPGSINRPDAVVRPSDLRAEATAALQAWAAATRGIPDDLFDGELVVTDATSVKLQVSHLYEERSEERLIGPRSSVPKWEYPGSIYLVTAAPDWSKKEQKWTGVEKGSESVSTCKPCRGTGDIRCVTCVGSGKTSCATTTSCSRCAGKGAYGSETLVRCESCNGVGKVQCTSCSGSGQAKCGSCSGSGREQCEKCEGAGELITFTQGTIQHKVKLTSMRAGLDGDGAAVDGVKAGDYESLLPSVEVIGTLPRSLRSVLEDEVARAWEPTEGLRRIMLKLLPVLAVSYSYVEHRGTAYLVGRRRRVIVPLTHRERVHLGRLYRGGSGKFAIWRAQSAAEALRKIASPTTEDLHEKTKHLAKDLRGKTGSAVSSLNSWRKRGKRPG
jgi:Trypsin-like peptidase domain